MNTQEETGRTPAELRAGRLYMWEFAIGMLLFMLSFLFLDRLVPAEGGSALAIVIAVIPMLPLVWIVVALVRHMRRMDERDRQMQLQSMSAGFGAAMLVSVGVSLVGTAGIDTRNFEWAIFIGGMATWVIALILSYRAKR